MPPHPTDSNSRHDDRYPLHNVGTASVQVGTGAVAGSYSVAVGETAEAELSSVAIGRSSDAAASGVAVGRNADALSEKSIAIGRDSIVDIESVGSIVIGADAYAIDDGTIAIGMNAWAGNGTRSIAIGTNANAPGPDTGLIKVNTMEVERSDGTGETAVILSSANGTRYKLTVSNAGALVVSPA